MLIALIIISSVLVLLVLLFFLSSYYTRVQYSNSLTINDLVILSSRSFDFSKVPVGEELDKEYSKSVNHLLNDRSHNVNYENFVECKIWLLCIVGGITDTKVLMMLNEYLTELEDASNNRVLSNRYRTTAKLREVISNK